MSKCLSVKRYNYWCQQVHGLSYADTDKAPVFPEACGFCIKHHHHALADAETCAWIAREIL